MIILVTPAQKTWPLQVDAQMETNWTSLYLHNCSTQEIAICPKSFLDLFLYQSVNGIGIEITHFQNCQITITASLEGIV